MYFFMSSSKVSKNNNIILYNSRLGEPDMPHNKGFCNAPSTLLKPVIISSLPNTQYSYNITHAYTHTHAHVHASTIIT